MIVVQMNDIAEFLNEVCLDQEHVVGRVVRVTVRRKRGGELPTVDFWLVASYQTESYLLVCDEYIGGGCQFPDGLDNQGQEAQARCRRQREALEGSLGLLGMEVRRGIFTVQ